MYSREYNSLLMLCDVCLNRGRKELASKVLIDMAIDQHRPVIKKASDSLNWLKIIS